MDFLDSDKFEQMARAYNEKYSQVNVMQDSHVNVDKLKVVLTDIHLLLSMYDHVAGSRGSFGDYFDKRKDLKNNMQDIAVEYSFSVDENVENCQQNVDNKTCINLLTKVIKDLFVLHNEQNFEIIERLLCMLLEATSAFYSGF